MFCLCRGCWRESLGQEEVILGMKVGLKETEKRWRRDFGDYFAIFELGGRGNGETGDDGSGRAVGGLGVVRGTE